MMYRGSWLVRQIVDSVAEDMTRAGVMLNTDMTPEDEASLLEKWQEMQLWQRLQATLKWARLYGGAIAVMMVDGQKSDEPLRVNSIGKDQFKGLMILDRWMIQPSLEDTVTDLGPNYGLPRYYSVVSDAHAVPAIKVHYSRCLRFEGVDLPYWQKMAENLWGLSVIEPMLDRMYAFDSTSAGAAQLVFKAHLRTYAVEGLRNLIAGGGKSYQAFLEQMGLIRLMQSNEGMTLMDATDKFESHVFNFGGLAEIMTQFAQQLAGAAQIPLVRLFGQSPAGLNATGDSDIRNYYDMINSQQEAKLRMPILLLMTVMHQSVFGKPLPEGFDFQFRPLWQLAESEKAQSSSIITQEVIQAYEQGIVSRQTALKELKEQSKYTSVWSNITDEEINAAETEPPNPMAMGMGEAPGLEVPPAKFAQPHVPTASPTTTEESAGAVLSQPRRPNHKVLAMFGVTPPKPAKADRVMALFGHSGKAAQVGAILTHDGEDDA